MAAPNFTSCWKIHPLMLGGKASRLSIVTPISTKRLTLSPSLHPKGFLPYQE